MKTERRNELKTNELADWLGKKIEAAKPYSRAIVGVVIGIGIGIVAYMFFSSQRAAKEGAGWQEYYQVSEMPTADGLRDIALRYEGTEVALWALASVADIELSMGSQQLFNDRQRANELFTSAQSNYGQVVKKAKHAFLKRRALFGLAQAYEAQNDLPNATEQYTNIFDGWPDSAIGEEAQQALSRIDGQKEFYDWFFDQRPTPTPNTSSDQISFGDLPQTPDSDNSQPGFDTTSLAPTDLANPDGVDASQPEAGDLDFDKDTSDELSED